jgi:leader peptidase (prepilin peptidase)/N-methyltransferase
MGLDPDTIPVWLAPLIVAPAIGSFLGVLIVRLPAGRPVGFARSACDLCGTPLTPRDMVPLLSFISLRGQCRHCRGTIGWLHPLVELAAFAVAAIAATVDADPTRIWGTCLLGWTLLTLAWIDARTMRLPDVLTLPLLLAGLAATWLLQPDALFANAATAALAYLALQALALAYRRLRGRDGLGEGDAKLLAAAGAWLGPLALPRVLVLAAGGGLLAALALAAAGRRIDRNTAMPFGPFLAAATWLLWLLATPS